MPKLFEMIDIGSDQIRLRCDDDIFVIAHRCLHCPIERSRDQDVVVDDGELVVHQVVGLLHPDERSVGHELGDEAPVQVGRVGVDNHSHLDAALLEPLQDGEAERLASDEVQA